MIPKVPTIFEEARQFIQSEIDAHGGVTGLLLLKNDKGEPNYAMAVAVYAILILIVASMFLMIKGSFSELDGVHNKYGDKLKSK